MAVAANVWKKSTVLCKCGNIETGRDEVRPASVNGRLAVTKGSMGYIVVHTLTGLSFGVFYRTPAFARSAAEMVASRVAGLDSLEPFSGWSRDMHSDLKKSLRGMPGVAF